MSYMSDWLKWTGRKKSDGDVIARMAADPFFKRWFIDRLKAVKGVSKS